MQLRTDFSILSFSAPVAWTGWSRVFRGKAMIQSRRHRSKDTTNWNNNKKDHYHCKHVRQELNTNLFFVFQIYFRNFNHKFQINIYPDLNDFKMLYVNIIVGFSLIFHSKYNET